MDVPTVPLMTFDEACAHVVGYLKKWVPLAFWSVSQFDGERQVYYYVQDDAYGRSAGQSHSWSNSFCQYMVAGVAPQIAPDAMAVPEYASAGVATELSIGAYAGVPIRAADGSLFGTLCGLDPRVQDSILLEQAPLLHLMATLLGQILQDEQLRSDAAEREAELSRLTLYDPLTGLPNRVLFADLVAGALDRAGSAARPVVAVLDLDGFTAINDAFGRAVGDDVLFEIAAQLSARQPFDAVARLGGDEFAILLDDVADLPAAMAVVERVFAEPFVVQGLRVPVSVSAGAAVVPPDAGRGTAQAVDVALARAEIAKYAAMQHPHDRFALHDPTMSLHSARDVQLREPLQDAIRSGAIEAVYQPVVELDTGRVIAFEALARWTHDGASVPPDVFVPVAGRCGFLPELTGHMMDLAGAQLARWSATLGHRRLQMAVNVPPSLITDPSFPDRVESCIRRHDLGRNQLILEITEEALLIDPSAARTVAGRLHDAGATLSLDDFGTGYSSLLHLQQIPLQSVKIDRGFTDDLEANSATRRFMSAVLALGRDLGLRVIVEGIERQTQAEVLHGLFGTHAQGYYFGPPAHAEDIEVHPDDSA